MEDLLQQYESLVEPARSRFDRGEWSSFMRRRPMDPDLLVAFLLHFCAFGVAMTRPVEGWIRRAGQRCLESGYLELGRALRQHAAHEAGHDAMMLRDAHRIAEMWNRRGVSRVDTAALLAREPVASVSGYAELHERVIASPAPFGQIAIELEIERLSVRYGPAFLGACDATLGVEVRRALSFLADHVAVDVGHTRFNVSQLRKLLADRPETLEPLAVAGRAALDSYRLFLEECLALGRRMVASERVPA